MQYLTTTLLLTCILLAVQLWAAPVNALIDAYSSMYDNSREEAVKDWMSYEQFYNDYHHVNSLAARDVHPALYPYPPRLPGPTLSPPKTNFPPPPCPPGLVCPPNSMFAPGNPGIWP